MNDTEIRKAMGLRLLSDLTLPQVVPPNFSPGPDVTLPYITVSFVPTGNVDRTLAGTWNEFTGFMFATVVSDKDEFEDPGLIIAQKISALFNTADRLTTASGKVTIPRPPEIMQGYEESSKWRTPIKVYYNAS